LDIAALNQQGLKTKTGDLLREDAWRQAMRGHFEQGR
jgi:hypothetical protein